MDITSFATNGTIHQRKTFTFDSVELSSDFCSGNMLRAEKKSDQLFWVYTAHDCHQTKVQTSLRTWFYFRVSAPVDSVLTFSVRNLNSQLKMFREGYKPVFKIGDGEWDHIQGRYTYLTDGDGNMELTFTQDFVVNEPYYFAFCFPWSCADNNELLESLAKSVNTETTYWHRETMVRSLEKRPLDLVTISDHDQKLDQREKRLANLFPGDIERPFKFKATKKVVFLSARVHPGEVPASHVMNGMLKFLSSEDPRAALLRSIFVFKLVPIINVDGVSRGFYRSNTHGINLNRLYSNPSISDSPEIYALREVITDLHKDEKKVCCYIDLHAHATKRGCFFYGNYMDYARSIESFLYAKLIELNDPNFDFEGSNFTEKNMRMKDKKGESREGSGRVGIFKAINIPRWYTLECNYNTGKVVNQVPPATNMEDPGHDMETPPKYTNKTWEELGAAMMIAILDQTGKNEYSRLPNSEYEDLEGCKIATAGYIAKQIPFRFDSGLKKAARNNDTLKEYMLKLTKPETKAADPKAKKPPIKKPPLANGNATAEAKPPRSNGNATAEAKPPLRRLIRPKGHRAMTKSCDSKKSASSDDERHSSLGSKKILTNTSDIAIKPPTHPFRPPPSVIVNKREIEQKLFSFNPPDKNSAVKLPRISNSSGSRIVSPNARGRRR